MVATERKCRHCVVATVARRLLVTRVFGHDDYGARDDASKAGDVVCHECSGQRIGGNPVVVHVARRVGTDNARLRQRWRRRRREDDAADPFPDAWLCGSARPRGRVFCRDRGSADALGRLLHPPCRGGRSRCHVPCSVSR